MLFEGKECEETRNVRGGDVFFGVGFIAVLSSRGFVGALLRRSQSFSAIPGVPSQLRATLSSRSPEKCAGRFLPTRNA